MNILVCVKRVPLTGGKIMLTDDERAIQTRHLGFTVSPHEECGAEEAVRLIEQHGGTSAVLTLGPPEAEEQLRDMMAIGVDRAIHLVDRRRRVGPPGDGRGDRRRRQAEQPEPARPDPVRQRVGRRRQLPGADPRRPRARTAVRHRGQGDRGRTARAVRCEQEVPGGRDVYEAPMPAVVTVKEGINLPRYPSVPGRLRAQAQAAARRAPAPADPRLEMVRLALPPGPAKQARCWATAPTPRPRWSRC